MLRYSESEHAYSDKKEPDGHCYSYFLFLFLWMGEVIKKEVYLLF